MAPMEFTARRAIVAFGIAIVTLAAPAVATFAGAAPGVAPRILAQCATHLDPGNAELQCEPPAVHEMAGAPTEMGLTGAEGAGDPASPVHGR